MKKAGIIGGIGPASTLDYYRDIIFGYRARVQSGDYPKLVIESVNMTEMLGYISKKQWDKLISLLLDAVENLAAAGADFAAIASNTPHIVFKAVQKQSALPLISIVEATCKEAANRGCKRAAVLGTAFTMGSGLYTEALKKYGIEAFVPDAQGQDEVQRIIFPNLEDGIVLPEDKEKILKIAGKLISENRADALVLGCTELPLIIQQGDLNTAILNTTQIHIASIIDALLQ